MESIKTTLHRFDSLTDEPIDVVITHTLCSDGRILRKYWSDPYKQVAKIKAHVPDPIATFRAYVQRYEAARS